MKNPRSSYLPIAGALLAFVLTWLLIPEKPKPAAGRPSAPPAPAIATVTAKTTAATKPVAKTEPALDAATKQLIADVRRKIEQPGARRREAVLTFKDPAAYRRFLARAGQNGVQVVGQIDALQTVRARYDSLDALQRDVADHPADYADPGANFLVQIPSAPPAEQRAAANQVPFGNNVLNFLGVTGDNSQWGRGTTIAVLDSGVNSDPTLQGRVRALDIGFGTSAGHGSEDGHGTAVAALAAGAAADAPGIAPGATILSVRVTDANGQSDIFTLAQGILAAVDAGAKIVNVSMGGYGTNTALNNAINYALDRGAVIVAAAGNDQAAQLAWPAADPRVISVGAVDAVEQQVVFSNSGPQLQMTAPGLGVQTAWLDGQRVTFDGTSASAPIVAGAIAAVLTQSPGLTATQAWQVLQKYASDAGAPGADPDYGNGILNLGWAMNRTDLGRVDTAVASHYYNPSTNQMELVVQNRGGQAVAGLQLNVDAAGTNSSYAIPTLAPGAIYVVRTPVDQAALAATGRLTFRSQLVNPAGSTDQVPANNRKSSSLTTTVAK
jgi:hypothetical protein